VDRGVVWAAVWTSLFYHVVATVHGEKKGAFWNAYVCLLACGQRFIHSVVLHLGVIKMEHKNHCLWTVVVAL
jgi:hypothetical protein